MGLHGVFLLKGHVAQSLLKSHFSMLFVGQQPTKTHSNSERLLQEGLSGGNLLFSVFL